MSVTKQRERERLLIRSGDEDEVLGETTPLFLSPANWRRAYERLISYP